ncbi:hypothetical protein [Streptomyces sp. NPDC020917]|uniref:hypothetical protein n=1 Tax=Streptomyces sp. NPDC020917 TaxID=3365102 RepID=UPI0037B6CA48
MPYLHMLRRRGPARRLAVLVAAVVVAGSIAAAIRPGHGGTSSRASTASDVLHRAPAPGSLHLVAFLATQPDTADTPSRAQAVALKSLQEQYGRKGLTIEIVDESGAGEDALVNTTYDWQLGAIRLAADPGGALARRSGVHTLPTVVLRDAAGALVKRWDSAVLTVQAAQVISGRLAAG